MGKDLHYTIRPFIERVLTNHSAVKEIEKINSDDFYAYKIKRNFGMSDIVVVLSDEYYFGLASVSDKPNILKDGGFYLIARPEANGFEGNIPEEKIGVGKIGKLLGALNKDEYWNYKKPKKKKE
ncbi:hypothetical protein [Tenacibaculum aestuariivivum]|uniref:hypothetical protein n=1 Tax=Tenacibaculum aestuariivivum TaxID=2006131 RepID=UPI003AB80F8D